jgi:hypothetical protein
LPPPPRRGRKGGQGRERVDGGSGQELLESLDDRWGPLQNRGLNRYPCWSWVTILSLYILKLGLQKRFGGLNLEAPTGVALTRQTKYFTEMLRLWRGIA